MVENHNEPESLSEISKSYSIMKYLDQLPAYLSDVLGVSKVALTYVIRDDAAAPNPLPNLQLCKPWSVGKTSLMEELVTHLPHTGLGFNADNTQLFSLLATHLGNTSAMASITQYQRRRDGRSAYLDLITYNYIWVLQSGKRHLSQLRSYLQPGSEMARTQDTLYTYILQGIGSIKI